MPVAAFTRRTRLLRRALSPAVSAPRHSRRGTAHPTHRTCRSALRGGERTSASMAYCVLYTAVHRRGCSALASPAATGLCRARLAMAVVVAAVRGARARRCSERPAVRLREPCFTKERRRTARFMARGRDDRSAHRHHSRRDQAVPPLPRSALYPAGISCIGGDGTLRPLDARTHRGIRQLPRQ